MAGPGRRSPDPWLAALTALAGVLLFWNLGGRLLWEDEAHTALLARSILSHGLPYAFDGLNWVTAEAGRDLGPGHLWRWSPWLQFYAAAASVKAFGPGEWACRLPFALAGLLCIPLTYLLGLRLFASRLAARFSAAALVVCVPFLLYARQARWYALAYAAVAGLLASLPGALQGRRRELAAGAFCAVALFYANHLVALGVWAALVLAAWAVRPRSSRESWRRIGWAAAAAALLILPGALYHGLWSQKAGASGRYLPQLFTYAAGLLSFLLPLPLLPLAVLAAWRRDSGQAGLWARFLLLFCAAFVLILSAGSWALFRYLSVLLPATAALCGLALAELWQRSRAAAVAALLLLVGTDLLHAAPLKWLHAPGTETADSFPAFGPVRSPLGGFLYELSHPLASCDRPLRDYLRTHARATDVVIASYGDFPLQYYTGLKVLGGMQGRRLVPDPDWIVLRSRVLSLQPGQDYDVIRYVLSGPVDRNRYERVDLACPDLMLAGAAEPDLHMFRAPAEGASLQLLHRLPAQP